MAELARKHDWRAFDVWTDALAQGLCSIPSRLSTHSAAVLLPLSLRTNSPRLSPQLCDELDRVITQEGSEYISAFIAEPILGTSAAGVTPPPDYYPAIQEICNRHNVLLIIDEVVTGFGRTGLNFGIDHWGVTPDNGYGKRTKQRIHAYCRYYRT